MNRALFLDRDGVINVEKNYVHKIEEFEFVDGIFDFISFFKKRNYLIIIVTNQAGIGRGMYTKEEFLKLNSWMIDKFEEQEIKISKVYYDCTHPMEGIGEYRRESFCRKPNPGMIIKAKEEFMLDFKKCILIGDKETDVEAGRRAGVGKNILIETNKISKLDINSIVNK